MQKFSGPCQKHLGFYLDEKLNFSQHITIKISKANKGIGIIKRLSHILIKYSFSYENKIILEYTRTYLK